MAKKTVWLPYDFDTAIGINNEGDLVFSYDLEDIDTVDGANVYNGQNSILWQNVRAAFGEEIKAMYQNLRSTGELSYEKVEQMFEEHQSKWAEAIFNEDSQFKYLDPLINGGDGTYLPMLQGSKAEQRKWWLWNRFRYLDSKYNAGDALTEVIQVRGYAKSDITVTPYASIYATIKYGSYLVQQRAERDVPITLECPLDNLNDTEIYIYSADQIADIGDLSGLKIGLGDFSKAIKLQNLKIGDSDPNYRNMNLQTLTLGNNTLLKTLDVCNCPNLSGSVDISHCTNIEEVYFEGTAIQGINLPEGGMLKKLHLPDTVMNLTIKNQPNLTDFVLNDVSNITTLVLENAGSIDSYSIFTQMVTGGRVRIIDFEWNLGDAYIEDIIKILSRARGIDVNGNTTELPQLKGVINIDYAYTSQITYFRRLYPDVTVNATDTSKYPILWRSWLLANAYVTGKDGIWDEVVRWMAPAGVSNYCEIWLPNINESITTAVCRGSILYLGIGKQGDTEVIPCTVTSAFGSKTNSRIYVPDDLVNEYKEATNYVEYADVIFPLSEAPYECWNGGVY